MRCVPGYAGQFSPLREAPCKATFDLNRGRSVNIFLDSLILTRYDESVFPTMDQCITPEVMYHGLPMHITKNDTVKLYKRRTFHETI